MTKTRDVDVHNQQYVARLIREDRSFYVAADWVDSDDGLTLLFEGARIFDSKNEADIVGAFFGAEAFPIVVHMDASGMSNMMHATLAQFETTCLSTPIPLKGLEMYRTAIDAMRQRFA